MPSIEVLAEREARAEASKGKADKTWRAAWWATTIALGSIPENEKKRIGTAQAIVREATGQSVGWVRDRTRAGRAFGRLETVETAPPRMAIQVVRAGITPTDVIVKQMVKAEKDGVGLRDFVADLTGRAWADTPEGASQATVEQIVAAQPEKVGKAVARSPRALRAVRDTQTHDQHEGLARHGINLDMPPTPFDGELVAEAARINAALDGVRARLLTLHRRCEPDQWPAVQAHIQPQMDRLQTAWMETGMGVTP